MDYLQKFVSQVRGSLFVMLLLNNLALLLGWWLLHEFLGLSLLQTAIGIGALAVILLIILPQLNAAYITKPTKLIWQTILHIAPDAANMAPRVTSLAEMSWAFAKKAGAE